MEPNRNSRSIGEKVWDINVQATNLKEKKKKTITRVSILNKEKKV